MIIPLESVALGTFQPLVGQAFNTTFHDADISLELAAARKLGCPRPNSSRDPFSLTFRGPTGLRLPQGIYQFACGPLGEIAFFITQVGDGPHGAEFEAIFT